MDELHDENRRLKVLLTMFPVWIGLQRIRFLHASTTCTRTRPNKSTEHKLTMNWLLQERNETLRQRMCDANQVLLDRLCD